MSKVVMFHLKQGGERTEWMENGKLEEIMSIGGKEEFMDRCVNPFSRTWNTHSKCENNETIYAYEHKC